MKELGIYAYNSLKNDIDTIKTPDFVHREFKSHILRKLMWITSERFIQFERKDKKYTLIISIGILILGAIFCGLNGFYSVLLFFIESDQNNWNIIFNLIGSFSYLINFFVFFIIIEGVTRIFYKKSKNTVNFLVSFAIIFYPMIFYLIFHLIFLWFNLLSINVVNLVDKILLIIFQVWSLWLLSFSLCVKKELKIESTLVISLLLHYGGFTIILFALV